MPISVKLVNIEKSFAADASIGNEIRTAFRNGSSHAKVSNTAVVPVTKLVLNKINLEINSGDRIGIIGRNGAGKSTLLHIIGGITEPSSGELKIQGKVTSIFTLGTGLREDLSGRENIYIDGELKGISRVEHSKNIDAIIDFADIGEFIDKPLKTYSTGMKARLAFAMITELDPEILIIDEALSVGDVHFSQKATRRINEICDKGKIVMIVSHSMGSILTMCNRCIWLDAGSVIMDGDPASVTEAYIKTVREADDSESLNKFHSLVGTHSYASGFRIDSLYVKQFENLNASKIVEVGSNVEIGVCMQLSELIQDIKLNIKISRVDDYIVFDETFNIPLSRTQSIKCIKRISFDPLVLAGSIYRIDAILLNTNTRLATGSEIFEVIQMRDAVGGKPMLIYPTSVYIKST